MAASEEEADFDEITSFLADHRWIFDFKLTRVFQDEVLANIPLEWKETFVNLSFEELAELPFGKIQTEWPDSLKLFIQNCVKFSLPREISELQENFQNFTPVDVSEVDPEIRRGMSHKKIHEVCHMTSLIDHVTRKVGNNGVVDVGSGLGYLGQVLHCNYGHSVLGLEGKQGHTTGADRRINKFDNCHHLHNVTCELNQQAQSQQEFLFLIQDWFSKLKINGHLFCHYKTDTRTLQTHGKSLKTVCSETQPSKKTGSKTFEDLGNKCVKQTGFKDSPNTDSLSIPEENLSECSKIEKLNTGLKEAMTCQTGSEEMDSSDFTSLKEMDGSDFTSLNEMDVSVFTSLKEMDGSDFTSLKEMDGSNFTSLKEMDGSDFTSLKEMDGSDFTSLKEMDGSDFTSLKEIDGSDCNTCSKEKESSHVRSSSKGMYGSDISTYSSSDFMTSPNELNGTCIDSTINKNKNVLRFKISGGSQSSSACCNELQSRDCDTGGTKCQQIGANDDAVVKVDNIPQLCMVGLHCCGDLTPTMLKHFVELDQITSLCCVSCCYHRMNFNENTQKHDNFPMSQLLKRSVAKTQQTHPYFGFSSYCLRLAAQETRARWHEQTEMDHDFHMRNVAYRGVLETCLQQDDKTFQLQKNVRKLAHKGDYESYITYIDAIFKHIHKPDEVSTEELRTVFKDKMQQKYDQYKQDFCLIEPLTALQYLLQPVIESLIYLDRKQWLQEQGLHADIVPVFDEFISPRNLALVAWK